MARNQRLNATLAIGSVLERSVGRNLNIIRRGLESVNSEILDLTRRRRDMERQRRELERQGRSVEELDREYEDLGRTLDDLRRRQERFERASAASTRVGERLGSATREVGRLARNAAFGVGALGGALVTLTRQQSEGIEGITRWANRIGVTTEYLSELDSVAGRFGLGTEDLVDGLKELSLRADEFAVTGAGPAAEAFERLGFSQAEVTDMASDTAAMFETVRERMSHIIDDAARQRIADELFGGTAGERMIEMLQLSQAELDVMRDEARAAGATITEEQSAIAREMSLAYGRVGAVIKGITRSVAVELMPALTTALNGLSDHLIENREEIVAMGAAFAERVGAAIPIALELASGVGKVIDKVARAVGGLAEFVGGWEELGVIIGTVIAGRALVSIGSLLISVGQLATAAWGVVEAFRAVGPASATAADDVARNSRRMRGGLGRIIGMASRFALPAAAAYVGLAPTAVGDGTMTDELANMLPADAEAAQIREMGAVPADWQGTNIGQSLRLVQQHRMGQALPTEAARQELRSYADELEREIAGLRSQITALGSGPMSESLSEPLQRELAARVEELAEVESEIGEADAAAQALGDALQEIMGSSVDIDIDMTQLDRAVERAIELRRELHTVNRSTASAATAGVGTPRPPQARAVGGAFRAGPVLVGERGPELRYEAASGFVAHHAALQRLAGYAEQAASGLAGVGRDAAQQVAQVTQNITINAQGLSAAAVIDEIERRRRDAERGALFDGAGGWGQYGGSHA